MTFLSGEKTGRRFSCGVSLVELMVVIAILGILMTFAVQFYGSTSNDARKVKAMNDMSGIKSAIKMFYVQSGGQYPPSIEALVGKYLPSLPIDPWGVPYKLDTVRQEIYCIDVKSAQKLPVKYGIPK